MAKFIKFNMYAYRRCSTEGSDSPILVNVDDIHLVTDLGAAGAQSSVIIGLTGERNS